MLLEVKQLDFSYGHHQVLHQIDFSLKAGKSVAIVGESGCGKSTLAHLLLGWLSPNNGKVSIDQTDLNSKKTGKHNKALNGVQVVLQNIDESLNPRMTAYQLIEEPIHYQRDISKHQYPSMVLDVAERVGLAIEDLKKYPHAFSGGQRQRIAIGRALILRPKLLICDEATSSLDASVAKSILHMMKHEISDHAMSLVFITHDIALASWMCDDMIVMNQGRMMEKIASEDLLTKALHPYTKKLISASNYEIKKLETLRECASDHEKNGCIYQFECSHVMNQCYGHAPSMRTLEIDHEVCCFMPCGSEEIKV